MREKARFVQDYASLSGLVELRSAVFPNLERK